MSQPNAANSRPEIEPDKPWHPHMRGGIVGNHQPIKTSGDAERLSNAMAKDGHYPAGLSVCFAAGINGDSPNHCLFAFTDDCVCTPGEQTEWTFTGEEVAALIAQEADKLANKARIDELKRLLHKDVCEYVLGWYKECEMQADCPAIRKRIAELATDKGAEE